MEHGRTKYINEGCRCALCKAGNAEYQREWRRSKNQKETMTDTLMMNKEQVKSDNQISNKLLAEATEHVKRLADIAERSADVLCEAVAKCEVRNA